VLDAAAFDKEDRQDEEGGESEIEGMTKSARGVGEDGGEPEPFFSGVGSESRSCGPPSTHAHRVQPSHPSFRRGCSPILGSTSRWNGGEKRGTLNPVETGRRTKEFFFRSVRRWASFWAKSKIEVSMKCRTMQMLFRALFCSAMSSM
jgi:hypothetical protein